MSLNFRRVISASLSPNTQVDDVKLARKVIFSPRLWKKGEAITAVEQWFNDYFKTATAVSFNSGRSTLLAILKVFGVGGGSEVLVQAFTCVAVPNSVLWAGAKPVYVDIDKTLNLDPEDLGKKITPNSRAVIVQHTFGIPAQIEKILTIARNHHLLVIEDCAHSLGVTYQGRKVGTWGDAAFFSFGRDKVASSVFGGMGIIREKYKVQAEKLRKYQEKLPFPSSFWIFQQLFHPLAFSVILTSYNIWLGKILLWLLQRLHLLSLPVYSQEKRGGRPEIFPSRFPNALAILLLKQLSKLEKYSEQRTNSGNYYQSQLSGRGDVKLLPGVEGAIYLRFPLLVAKPLAIMQRAKRQGILLGNWYTHLIDPVGVELKRLGYVEGSCPRAESIAGQILNLPTLLDREAAAKVVSSL